MENEKGMTIKEIADIVNVDRATIFRWAHKIDPMQNATGVSQNAKGLIEQKLEEAQKSGTEPARFTLDEVIAVIRAGGRETLADLLADNARRKQCEALDLPENGAIRDLLDIVKRQMAVIESVMAELKLSRRLETGSPIALLPDRSGEDGEWINTSELSALYGKSRATCLSHARAMGWDMWNMHPTEDGKMQRRLRREIILK
jgi:AcrR family transcriptional regulator